MNKIQSAIDQAKSLKERGGFMASIPYYEKVISLQNKEMKEFNTLMNNQLEAQVKKIDKLEKDKSELFSTIIGEEPLKAKVDKLTAENKKLKKKNPYYKELQRLIKKSEKWISKSKVVGIIDKWFDEDGYSKVEELIKQIGGCK